MDDARAALGPGATGPPAAQIESAIQAWVAAVLSVLSQIQVPHLELLRYRGRTRATRNLTMARRLLIWLFVEVSDASTALAIAWLEQCLGLGKRSIKDVLAGAPPVELQPALQVYTRLMTELGPDDVAKAVAAGVLGQRSDCWARIWPKGFLERLGVR